MRVQRKRSREEVREIRKIMIGKDISQSGIAKKLGVSVSAVNQVVTGKRSTPKIVKALIEAGVPDVYLCQKELSIGEAA